MTICDTVDKTFKVNKSMLTWTPGVSIAYTRLDSSSISMDRVKIYLRSTVIKADTRNIKMVTSSLSARESFEDRYIRLKAEVDALSDEEYMAELESVLGSWADREDIGDDWLDKMREGWKGFTDFFNNEIPV